MIDDWLSAHRVPDDGGFRVASAPTAPAADAPGKKACGKELKALQRELQDLQRRLYAEDKRSLLLVFQAMDAAGKDGTVRAVMSRVNPAGCQVSAFKAPSKNELDHDFLWRSARKLPERGRIGIFNRSYYEEVLVVRVHPEFLAGQRLPVPDPISELWDQRYGSIRDHERHLASNGTVVLKFWLNVSRDEQRRRFVDRIDDPAKNWKFNRGDVRERGHWDAYMAAYEAALNATSRACAPWFAIPADNKPYARLAVARVVVGTLRRMNPAYPTLPPDELAGLAQMRDQLLTTQ